MKLKDIEKNILEGKKLTDDEKEFACKRIDSMWWDHPDVTVRFPHWKKYIAWVAGYQLVDYNRHTQKLTEVPYALQHRLIVNKLKPYVRTLLAKLTSDMPQMSIIPNTEEDNDIKAARVGDKVIEGLADKLAFDQTMTNLKLWTIICNRAFLRVFWNEKDRGLVGFGSSEENEDITPEQLSLDPLAPAPEAPVSEPAGFEPIYEDGEVCIECVSPFNCRVDPLYFSRDKWRWFIYGDETDADSVEEQYGLKSGTLKEGKNPLDNAYDLEYRTDEEPGLETTYGSDTGFSTEDSGDGRDDKITGRTIIRKEYWTPKIFIFTAGDKVLDYGKNEKKEIPFYVIEDRLVPIENYNKGFVYNEGLVKDAIPIQREYNKISTIMSRAMEQTARFKVLAPLGSLMNKKQWVNDYGVFIDYNPHAGEPHQMKTDTFPVEMPAYKQGLQGEMESMMSLGPASFGQLPERASHASGTLVNLLLEQDDVVLNPLLNQINRVIGQAWSLAMSLVQDNYATDRLIKITGEDGADDVIKFKGAQLRGNTDVRVISQTGLPRSRALRIEYIMKLREVGLLTDDRATLEMLEFGNANKIFKDNLLHERRAYRENSKIADNPNIDPNEVSGWVYPLEDHVAHIKIHFRDRLSSTYDSYADNQKAALDLHIQETVAAIQAQAPPPPPGPGTTANEQAPPTSPEAPAPPETAAPV